MTPGGAPGCASGDEPYTLSFRVIPLDERSQREVLARLLARLAPDGALVVGRHERPPPGASLRYRLDQPGIYRHAAM